MFLDLFDTLCIDEISNIPGQTVIKLYVEHMGDGNFHLIFMPYFNV